MTKCQYQQCKRVLNTRVEQIKQNGNQIKSTHIYECVNNICNAVLNKSAQPSKIGAVTNINSFFTCLSTLIQHCVTDIIDTLIYMC